MAITNFISTVWTENLYKALDKHYVTAANCNRDYEGDVKGTGSVVKICGVGGVTVSDYKKNTDMSTPQTLDDTCKELHISQAKYFNFQVDDVDKAQSTPKLMDAAMDVAARALSDRAESYIFNLFYDARNQMEITEPDAEALVDFILNGRQKLFARGVTDPSDIFLEVTPDVATMLIKAKVILATDNKDTLDNGCIGSIFGCKVYVSNNVVKRYNDDMTKILHHCIMRTKRSVAYVEQLSEIEAYRPERRFADAVKGLHLYGACIAIEPEYQVLTVIVNNPEDPNAMPA